MPIPSKFVEALLNRDLKSAGELLANGADANLGYEPGGWTALHYMVENMVVESTRWLLENGADPNQKDATGWTPLLLAIDAEGDYGTREFVEKGLFPPAAELTKLLLEHGTDPNTKSNNGQTPLALAKRYNHTRAVDMLMRYGAKDFQG
jgi:ankyrin repeat protein